MALAYETATAASNAIKQASLESVIEGLDPLLGQIDQIIERAANCADKINGMRPPSAAAQVSKDAPEPHHLIWKAQARRDRLSLLVERLATEIGRIDGGLG